MTPVPHPPADQRLREALEPFAKMGRMLDGPFAPALFKDGDPIGVGAAWSENGEKRTITFGDLRRAAAALAAPLDDGWRPIGDAPKDGTPILIFQPDAERESTYMPIGALADNECSYRHSDPRLQRYDDHRWAIGYWRPWGGWGNRNCSDVRPTHYHPLPSAPTSPMLSIGEGM